MDFEKLLQTRVTNDQLVGLSQLGECLKDYSKSPAVVTVEQLLMILTDYEREESAELVEADKKDSQLDMPLVEWIKQCGLSARAQKVLLVGLPIAFSKGDRQPLRTLGHLVENCRVTDLRLLKNCGETTTVEIVDAVSKAGYVLKAGVNRL